MQDVLFFGSLGKVAYKRDSEWFLVQAESGEPERVREGDVGLYLDSMAEVQKKTYSVIKPEKLQEELAVSLQNHRALETTLDCFNPKWSVHTRELCADAAAELLSDQRNYDFVKNRMFSRPLPEEADAKLALKTTSGFNRDFLSNLVNEILLAQNEIKDIREIWKTTVNELFDSRAKYIYVENIFVEAGVFVHAVEGLLNKKRNRVSMLPVSFKQKLEEESIPGNILVSFAAKINKLLPKEDLPAMSQDHDWEGEVENTVIQRRQPIPYADVTRIMKEVADIVQTFMVESYKDAEKLLDKLRKYQQGSPRWAKSLCNIAGQIRNKQDLKEKAIELYREAQKIDPTDAVSFTGMAEVCKAQRNYVEALKLYGKAQEIDPGNAVSFNGMAEVYKAQRNYVEALKLYGKAQEIDPGNAVSFTGMAEVCKAQRNYVEALKLYGKAQEIDPGNAVSFTGMAEVYKAQRNYEKALELYEKAQAIDSDDVYNLCGLSFLWLSFNKIDKRHECAERFIRALEIDHLNPVANIGLYTILKLLQITKAELNDQLWLKKSLFFLQETAQDQVRQGKPPLQRKPISEQTAITDEEVIEADSLAREWLDRSLGFLTKTAKDPQIEIDLLKFYALDFSKPDSLAFASCFADEVKEAVSNLTQ